MTLTTILNKTDATATGPYQFVDLADDYDAFWMPGAGYGGAAAGLLNRAGASGDLTAEASTDMLQTGTRVGYTRGYVTPYTEAQLMSEGEVTLAAYFVPDPSTDQQLIGNLAVGEYYVSLTQSAAGVAATFNAPLVQVVVNWDEMPEGATEPLFAVAQFSTTAIKLAVWRPAWTAPLTDQGVITGTWPSSEPVRVGSTPYNLFTARPLLRMAGFKKALVADDAAMLTRFKRLESLAFAGGVGTRGEP